MENSVDKYRISIARGHFIKDYLWRKIEAGTLYFSANSRFATPPIIACKHQNIVNLSSHVTLYVVSALSCKNSVVLSGIGGENKQNWKLVSFLQKKVHMLMKRVEFFSFCAFMNEKATQSRHSNYISFFLSKLNVKLDRTQINTPKIKDPTQSIFTQ